MSDDKETTQVMGCVMGLWGFFITGPMYLALLYLILSACEPGKLAWGIFYFYIPAHLGGIAMSATAAVLGKLK